MDDFPNQESRDILNLFSFSFTFLLHHYTKSSKSDMDSSLHHKFQYQPRFKNTKKWNHFLPFDQNYNLQEIKI